MPKLLISLPSGDISKEVSGDVITIGRTPDNKVQIDHHSVSAHHARLILSNGNYKIKDLDSTNRSCVNGIPVNEAELTGSCFLRFGNIECVYKTENSESASSNELQSQLNELQRQLDTLIKARDLISQQNQALTKERDQARQSADNHLDQLNDAKKQLEQISAGGNGNQLQLHEVSSQLGDAVKQIEALTQERNALLQSNEELKAQVETITAQLNEARQKAAQPPLNVQQQAAARVKQDMDESVEEDFEEQELAGVGQRTAVAGGSAGRVISGAPLLGSWLNRGTGPSARQAPWPSRKNPATSLPCPRRWRQKMAALATW